MSNGKVNRRREQPQKSNINLATKEKNHVAWEDSITLPSEYSTLHNQGISNSIERTNK